MLCVQHRDQQNQNLWRKQTQLTCSNRPLSYDGSWICVLTWFLLRIQFCVNTWKQFLSLLRRNDGVLELDLAGLILNLTDKRQDIQLCISTMSKFQGSELVNLQVCSLLMNFLRDCYRADLGPSSQSLILFVYSEEIKLTVYPRI